MGLEMKWVCPFWNGEVSEGNVNHPVYPFIDVIIDPTKYFGCELGAQTNFDMKNERFIVNGEHDAAKLQDILDGFIKKFVLCAACENPETTLVKYLLLLLHFTSLDLAFSSARLCFGCSLETHFLGCEEGPDP